MNEIRTPRVDSRYSRVLLGLALVLLCGCGSDGPELFPVRGKILHNGKPLGEGTVTYLPLKPDGRQASGGIGKDGTFELTTFEKGDGALRGEYGIVIFALEPHPGEPTSREDHEAMAGQIHRASLIPEKYTNIETSGLRDTVDENHPGTKRIELSD